MSTESIFDDLVVRRAAKFSEFAHEGQERKYTGADFYNHPRRVAERFARHPLATPESVAAAYLHDVIEDTDVTIDILRGLFPTATCELVVMLTNPSKNMDKRKTSRAQRKEVDRMHLHDVAVEAKVIKLIDRIDNLREMQDAPVEFVKLYAGESRLLASAIGAVDSDLCNELLELVESLESQDVNQSGEVQHD